MKLAVGVITFEGEQYCREAFFASLQNLTYPEFDVIVVTNSGEEDKKDIEKALKVFTKGRVIVKNSDFAPKAEFMTDDWKLDHCANNREMVREEFLQGDWSHLLFVDSDTFIPMNSVEVLAKHDRDMVAGVYLSGAEDESGKKRIVPVFWGITDTGEEKRASIVDVLVPRLVHASQVGMGCCLIKRPVLEKIGFKLYTETKVGEDVLFCREAIKAGFKLYCDTRVRGTHVKFPIGDPRNKLYDVRSYKLDVKKK